MKTSINISLFEAVKVTFVAVAMCCILYSVDGGSTCPTHTAAQTVQGSQFLTLNK